MRKSRMNKETSKISKKVIHELLMSPCANKWELDQWLKFFLAVDFAAYKVCENSTTSLLDICWKVYNAAKTGNPRETSFLFIAARGCSKTLLSAVLEVLMMYHFRRQCCHIAAILSQSQKAADYAKRFFSRPYLKDYVIASNSRKVVLSLKNAADENVYVEIVVCTLQGVNGPRGNFTVFDETDVVKDIRAYEDASMINVAVPITGEPPITFSISSRKSGVGLVQYEIDRADKKGTIVDFMNIIDITEKCPTVRHGSQSVKVYLDEETLDTKNEQELERLPVKNQSRFTEFKGYSGCLTNCQIFSLCRARLPNQKSTSLYLKKIEEVSAIMRETTVENIISQLLCLRPPTHGAVFTHFDTMKHVVSYAQMYEKLTGEEKESCTKFELISEFKKRNIPAYAGFDWGWSNPSTCIIAYMTGNDDIYVIEELGMTYTDDSEFIEIVKNTLHGLYNIQMCFPDTANGSAVRLLRKAGFTVTEKHGKESIYYGIQLMKRHIKSPGSKRTKLCISSTCKSLIEEMQKYHFKLDERGQIVADDRYAEEFDHQLDALRYIFVGVLGKHRSRIDYFDIKSSDSIKTSRGDFLSTPNAEQLAEHLGIPRFVDNTDKYKKSSDDEEGGTPFSFSF